MRFSLAVRRLWPATLACLLILTALAALPAFATPATLALEGVLTSTGGAAAADGAYKLTIALYDGEKAAKPAWTEGPLDVQVSGGRFTLALGASKALDGATLAGLAAPWLGITVGSDPELPRKALHAAPFALVASTLACSGCVGADQISNGAIAAAKVGFNFAGSATKGGAALDLACTGCVSVAELAFDGDVDLGGNSLKAKNATFSGDIAAKTMTASAFVGDGSKLTGIATAAGNCPSGQAVTGIAADGKLVCKALVSALPADGLDEISGGLLGTQFKDLFGGQKLPVPIPDNTGSAAVAAIDIGDLGTIEGVRVEIEVSNTDLSTVSIVLLPPDDKQTGFTLCDPCGDKGVKSLKTSYPDLSKPATGDLATLIGKSPKGAWTLKVLDASFCLPQAPGNAALCDIGAKTDGAIVGFAVEVATLSKTKVGVFAPLQLFKSKDVPYLCDNVVEGAVFYDLNSKRLRFCDGMVWRSLADACGNGVMEPGEDCDDGNNSAGDGCSEICLASAGFSATKAVASCQAVIDAWKKEGATAKSGVYWLDLDGNGGKPAFRTWCEMDALGGGWTLLFNLDSGDGKRHIYSDTTFWQGVSTEGSADKLLVTGSKTEAFSLLGGKEVLILAHDGGKVIAWGAYDLLAAYQGKPLMTLMNGGQATISATRKAQSGDTGCTLNTKRTQTRYGDPFVDPKNGEALVVNKQSGWAAGSNQTRLMTTVDNAEYGHTFSGLGGTHTNSGWGQDFESAPIASYCDCTNLYGEASNMQANGQSTSLATTASCYDPSLFKFLPVDVAVFVR